MTERGTEIVVITDASAGVRAVIGFKTARLRIGAALMLLGVAASAAARGRAR